MKESEKTRSRSSSQNSSVASTDSSNCSNSKSSVSRQSNITSQKVKKASHSKMHQKEKFAVRVRKKLLKNKILKASKETSNMSDCESTKSSSSVSGIIMNKKAKRGRKRKYCSQLVQKKFASIVPSSSSVTCSSIELNTSTTLAKAEDFINFLCLRGHPLMPKEFEVFNNTHQPHTPFSDDDSPSSPPSSLVSELASSPASSLPLQNSVDSPCETPVCETPFNSEDDGALSRLHAMRMYAGIENRPKTTNGEEGNGEITIAEMDSEEETNKIPKSVTPPLSFRVSPRSAPPITTTSTTNLSPSPAPLMITSPLMTLPSTSGMNHSSLGIDKARDLYPTPDSSAFGSPVPPPLMLSPGKSSSLSSNNCCSPPPLLYIPAAAQRVTHLHGPPKLERVQISSDAVPRKTNEGYVQDTPPILVKHKPLDVNVESRYKQTEHGSSFTLSSATVKKASESKITAEKNPKSSSCGLDQNSNGNSHERGDQVLSCTELPCDNLLPRPSSTGNITAIENRANLLSSSSEESISQGNNLRNFQRYTRNSRSCPLHSSSDSEKVKTTITNMDCHFLQRNDSLNAARAECHQDPNTNSFVVSHKNQGFCALHSLKRIENESSPTKKISVIDLSNADSPDSSLSLGGSSLIENLQRAHDGNASVLRNVALGCGENENENSISLGPSLKDPRHLDTPSPLPNFRSTVDGRTVSEGSKSPLVNSPLTISVSPEIEQGRFSPSVRRLRSGERTGTRLSQIPVTDRQNCARSFTPTNPGDKSGASAMQCFVDSARTSPFAPVRDQITPTLTPPGPASFTGQFRPHSPHLTNTPPPFDCGFRETLSPPWSHLQPAYSLNNTPPRPYTLSINSPSSSPIHNNHFCASNRHYTSPRAIPILPPSKIPTFNHGQLVSPSPHFNGEFRNSPQFGGINFGRNLSAPLANQTYKLPSAFEATSPRKEQFERKVVSDCGSSSSNETRNENPTKSGNPTIDLSISQTQNISVDLSKDGTKADSQQPSPGKLLHDQHTGTTENSRDLASDVVRASVDSDKGAVHTEVKKRRGRPPGSKNKKPSTKNSEAEVKSKKETSAKEETPKDEEDKDSTSPNGRRTKKVESPILRPTEEEFKDPIKYLKSVQSTLKKFGICIIDPPESWKLESHLPGNPRFTTKRQLIHRLQKRWGPTEIKLACIEKHIQQQQSSFNFTQMPVVGGCDLDLAEVSRVVKEHGGMQKVIDTKKWNKVADVLRIPKSTQDRIGKLQDAYCKYLLSFDLLPESEKETLEKEVKQEIQESEESADQNKCYLKGRSFSMGCFQRTARSFQDHFFKSEPSVSDVEREYWKIVQSREKYVAVHHVKLDTRKHGSCFPTSKSDPYTKSGWNLNVLSHLKGSALRHTGNVQDLTVPWLNIDMLFSTKRWTTTPLQTYLIDYLHSSNDKVWYGVPESDVEKFPHTKKGRTNDFEDGESMVSPSTMTRESDVNVTRLVQKQGQFVVIAPRVFHCNISSGYSVSETVAFAFPDWILRASSLDMELFSEWPGFSYERVLLKVADEVTNSDKDILECLHSELKRVRDNEESSRKELKGLGVIESSCTSTTAKGVQTIKTKSGSIQVNSSAMYCGQCHQLCHLSAVVSEEDSETLCLSDAIEFIQEENSSEYLSIITNCTMSQIDKIIESVQRKITHKDKN